MLGIVKVLILYKGARVMAYTLYLNSVEEGGETEFLYPGVKIKPYSAN